MQSIHYEIDHVWVCNFVLPLYFTAGNEAGSRNDFLGTELDSFGVGGGGYIGFYDPELGSDDFKFGPELPAARNRLGLRLRTGRSRRTVRHAEHDPIQAFRTLARTGTHDPGPWFEGFAIDVTTTRADPYDTLVGAATAVLGEQWERDWDALMPTRGSQPKEVQEYELVPRRGHTLGTEEAWDLTYALRTQRGVAAADPDFVFFVANPEALEDDVPAPLLGSFGSTPDSDTDPHEWAIRLTRTHLAWRVARGTGVTVAHTDTGCMPHSELPRGEGGGQASRDLDRDFVDDDFDAQTELRNDNPLPGGPNHGTATGSVIVSARGSDPDAHGVSGVAPDANLVPIRVGNSVVHFSMRRARQAVEYAIMHDLPVVSMSLGGPFPNRRFRRVLQEARRQGILVIAAGGNAIPFRAVVWPARYAEVIAVAACNVRREPWSKSSRGAAIDITAPGEGVWRARVTRAGADVKRSDGTSYATAMTAGAAALWLSRHGVESLRQRYPGRLTDAFRVLLRETAQPEPTLPSADFGGGILDADALLNAPLPTPARERAARPSEVDDSSMGALHALFPDLSSSELEAGLSELLGQPLPRARRAMDDVGEELIFRLATGPRLAHRFAARMRRAAGLRRGRQREAARRAAWTYRDVRVDLVTGASERLRRALDAADTGSTQ